MTGYVQKALLQALVQLLVAFRRAASTFVREGVSPAIDTLENCEEKL